MRANDRPRNPRRSQKMKITITRESELIFTAVSDAPYWSDGEPINSRLAFDSKGNLCSMRAQSIDRQSGNRYMLPVPFGIRNRAVIEVARNLQIGELGTIQL